MCLIPIIVFCVIYMILAMVLSSVFADPVAAAAMQEAAEAADFGAMMKFAGSGGMTTMGAIITALVIAAAKYVIAMVFNGMIKHDGHDNQFGPEAGTS